MFFCLIVLPNLNYDDSDTDLKPEERRPGATCDELEKGALLVLAEVLHHGPEGGDGGVGQLVTPGVVGVGLQSFRR